MTNRINPNPNYYSLEAKKKTTWGWEKNGIIE